MKKDSIIGVCIVVIGLVVLSILFAIACNNSTKSYKSKINYVQEKDSTLVEDIQEDVIQTKIQTKQYKILDLVDTISQLYPNFTKNDIQKKKAESYALMEFTTNFNKYINEIPMKFEMMLPYGSQYIIKFEAGKYTTNDKRLKGSYNNYINLCVYGYVSAKEAETLIEDKTYYISGSEMHPYLSLANGDTYLEKPYYCFDSWSFCGVIKNIKFTKK